MTLTERNQKLFELRQKLNKAHQKLWIEQRSTTKDEYDRQGLDLFKEMGLDTPMFDEVYGG